MKVTVVQGDLVFDRLLGLRITEDVTSTTRDRGPDSESLQAGQPARWKPWEKRRQVTATYGGSFSIAPADASIATLLIRSPFFLKEGTGRLLRCASIGYKTSAGGQVTIEFDGHPATADELMES